MYEVTILGVDLAKNVFQLHGGRGGRVGRVPQEAAAAVVREVHGGTAAWSGGDGYRRWRASAYPCGEDRRAL